MAPIVIPTSSNGYDDSGSEGGVRAPMGLNRLRAPVGLNGFGLA